MLEGSLKPDHFYLIYDRYAFLMANYTFIIQDDKLK